MTMRANWQRKSKRIKGLENLRTWGTNPVTITEEEAKIGKEKMERCGQRLN